MHVPSLAMAARCLCFNESFYKAFWSCSVRFVVPGECWGRGLVSLPLESSFLHLYIKDKHVSVGSWLWKFHRSINNWDCGHDRSHVIELSFVGQTVWGWLFSPLQWHSSFSLLIEIVEQHCSIVQSHNIHELAATVPNSMHRNSK